MGDRPIHEYKAVLFDCDDTILETSKTRWDVMRKTAAAVCQYDSDAEELTEEMIRAVWGQPFDKMIRQLLPGIDYDDYVHAYRAAMRAHPPTATPGAQKLLAFLSDHEIDLRIVSSGSHDLVEQDLEDLDMHGYFTRIYACEDTRYHKPDRRALKPPIKDLSGYLRRRRIRRSNIVYIGDAVRDRQASRWYGIDFIGVTSGLESHEDLKRAGVSRIVDRLDELIQGEVNDERRRGDRATRPRLRARSRLLQAAGLRDGLGA